MMNHYRTVGNGVSFTLVDWRGEKVWLAKGSTEHDHYLEEGIRALMTSPPRTPETDAALRQPEAEAELTVTERRATLQWSARWEGATRIVRHVELRETVTIERFD